MSNATFTAARSFTRRLDLTSPASLKALVLASLVTTSIFLSMGRIADSEGLSQRAEKVSTDAAYTVVVVGHRFRRA